MKTERISLESKPQRDNHALPIAVCPLLRGVCPALSSIRYHFSNAILLRDSNGTRPVSLKM